MFLTLKEQSRFRRLLREYARAKARGWLDDQEILEAEIEPLVNKLNRRTIGAHDNEDA
jgi:hypothetical protein